LQSSSVLAQNVTLEPCSFQQCMGKSVLRKQRGKLHSRSQLCMGSALELVAPKTVAQFGPTHKEAAAAQSSAVSTIE